MWWLGISFSGLWRVSKPDVATRVHHLERAQIGADLRRCDDGRRWQRCLQAQVSRGGTSGSPTAAQNDPLPICARS